MKKEVMKMRYKIGVMGKAARSKELSQELLLKAKEIGKEIARNGCVLVTGACMGVPHIAAKAASKEGGLILGYSPAKDLQGHIEPPISYPFPPENMELIFTGYGKIGRNVLSIFECDGVVFVSGGVGTLNEFSIAVHEGKVIGVLEGLGGLVEKILPEIKSQTLKKGGAVIVKDRSPKRLIKKVIQEVQKRKDKIRKEVPITFKNKRGEQLVGVFHLPQREKPPLVVLIPGFGCSKSERKKVKLARILQKEGIAVFRFDFSGSGDSEGELENTTVKKEIEDLEAVMRTIFKEADLDNTRVAFVAESLGAVVAVLYKKNQFNVPLKTMVFWAPAFCQKELLKTWHTKEELRKWKEKGYIIHKDKKIGLDYLKENENKDYSSVLGKIDLPILILHGKEDETVPIKYSEKLARKYKHLRLIELASNHKFEDFNDQRKLITETVKWIKKYL
ncbi:alpha/beta hydrolase [bacterium]|nr:alpha/beta hydrolase [bacterium]